MRHVAFICGLALAVDVIGTVYWIAAHGGAALVSLAML